MKNYQSFLSEQKEFLSEQTKKATNRARTSGSQSSAFAGLGGGKGDDVDTVISDTGYANILSHGNYAYQWADAIAIIQSQMPLNITYNQEQLVAILKQMSERERKKVEGYLTTLNNFKDSHVAELLSTSLKKSDLSAGTFIPSRHAQWGR